MQVLFGWTDNAIFNNLQWPALVGETVVKADK